MAQRFLVAEDLYGCDGSPIPDSPDGQTVAYVVKTTNRETKSIARPSGSRRRRGLGRARNSRATARTTLVAGRPTGVCFGPPRRMPEPDKDEDPGP